jgi:GNAT superfamily N-acetyltransferase
VVGAIVAAWQRRTGGSATPTMAQALHALDRVIPPERPAPGILRPGAPAERGLLRDWASAFARESGVVVDPDAMVDRRLERGFLHVWDDGGPVSMVGRTPVIAGAVRIAPVYTPPALRGRGYASGAVAAISQAQLDAGAERCILFTDLANPTSNRIYAAVGYRSIAAWEHVGFEP